jgi:hypothetical protein
MGREGIGREKRGGIAMAVTAQRAPDGGVCVGARTYLRTHIDGNFCRRVWLGEKVVVGRG